MCQSPPMLMGFVSSLIFLLSASHAAVADEVLVAFGKEKPPFVFGLEARGLEIDIFREALADSGHTLSVQHFDNGALIDAVLQQRADAAATARSDDPEICVVEQFIRFENVAVSLADHALVINQVTDLANHRVVAWDRAHLDLGDAFFQLFAPHNRAPGRNYMEHHSQEAQVKMFWLNRTDVIVIDRVIFEWYRSQMPPSYKSQRDVHFHEVFSTPTWYPALFKDRALCEQFRVGLARLKDSGRYAELYHRYLNVQ